MSNEMPAVLVGLVHLHDCAFVNEGLLFLGKSLRLAGIKWHEEGRRDQQNSQLCFTGFQKGISHEESSAEVLNFFQIIFARRFQALRNVSDWCKICAPNVTATSLAGNRRVTRKFCIRQKGSTIKKMVGPDCEWREKIVTTRSGDEIVLVHTIATYADCADENPVAVKTKRAGENRDPVRESGIWVERRVCRDRSGMAMIA